MAIITVSSTASSGKGSLREAILQANSGDTIRFDSALANKTIRLREQLVVDKSLTIDGADAPNLTISGENKTRILRISYDYSDVVLRNLTFAKGKAVDKNSNTTLRGGAIEVVDSNTLVVENSRFIKNVGERGGAIFIGYGSNAKIRNSLFDGNDGSVANDGFSAGAISTYGGGKGAKVVNSNGKRNVGGNAFLDIRGSTFTNNKGTYGAVYTLLTGLRVENSVFKNNQGVNGSGAIFTDGANGTEKKDNLGGKTLIRNVVAEDNVGGGDYGGAFFLSGYSKDKIVIDKSKIINNRARRGGGLAVQSYRDEQKPVSLIITNSTIANNTSTSQGGGLWTDVKGGVKIKNSTFTDNRVINSQATGIGGAIVLNYKTSAKSTITKTDFADNYAGTQAGNIWIAGKQQAKNLTISNSRFAGNRSGNKKSENTVNFQVNNGGRNVVQNINGADNGIPGAKFVEELELTPLSANRAINSELSQNREQITPQTANISPPELTPTVSENNISSPELTPTTSENNITSPELTPLRYEAEELTLTNYQVETVKGSGASSGKHISLKGTGKNRGFATGTFTGEAGIYEVEVGLFDENDGQSKAKVTVGEEKGRFIFDQDLPHNWVKPITNTSSTVIDSVELKSGDTFKIEGIRNKGEFARFDYIEFIPKAISTADNLESVSTSKSIAQTEVINAIVNLRNLDLDGDGETDEQVSLIVDDITGKTSYQNSGGFYQVLDLDGSVIDTVTNQIIRPGEPGYETAALNQRIAALDFSQNTEAFTTKVDAGIFLAPYLIANGTPEEFINKNPNNSRNRSGLNAYFAFGNANPDRIQHLKSSDNNFGFEDFYGGGDKDFNDLTFNVALKAA